MSISSDSTGSSNLLSTRRSFLRNGMLGAATAYSVPAFVHNTFLSLNASAEGAAIQTDTGKDSPILVVLQLAGGNDGLNTVVPYADDAYYQARPKLGHKADALLKLNDHLGLSDALPFLHSIYDSGNLAIVQGVGYPNPNRSHFRSTEIWQAATDADEVSKTGWLGRYFDSCCQGAEPDPSVGVALSKKQPQSFSAKKNPGISLSSPELYRWIRGGKSDELADSIFEELNSPDSDMQMEADAGGGSIDENVGKSGGMVGESTLDFLERTALDARLSSDEIVEISRKHKSKTKYPGSKLATNLSLVSRMIAGGLKTRVYYVSHGGFDTHRNQSQSHSRLIGEMDSALKSFMSDLKEQGNADRVTVMTFSEFGRRVEENASGGTDHGAAAPLFVLGGGVKGGIYGKHPSLTDLNRGDLKFNVDFRSVYATVLEQRLNTPAKAILGREFEKLAFI
ncbi:MAG: DUF1501 domain-containing protein [Verrucomicrobiae bacterium]|nr:DUF1501 domain-containing protein [Verrucomicrobiae bacterium]